MVELIKTTMELSSVHRGHSTMYAARLAQGPECWPFIYVLERQLQAHPRNTYRHRTRTPYASLAIDAGARTSRGGRSVMGGVHRGSWWVDLRPGRRGRREGSAKEVSVVGCFPRRGVQDTSLFSDDPRIGGASHYRGKLTRGHLSAVRQPMQATQ